MVLDGEWRISDLWLCCSVGERIILDDGSNLLEVTQGAGNAGPRVLRTRRVNDVDRDQHNGRRART